jgi:hypothetical protein
MGGVAVLVIITAGEVGPAAETTNAYQQAGAAGVEIQPCYVVF